MTTFHRKTLPAWQEYREMSNCFVYYQVNLAKRLCHNWLLNKENCPSADKNGKCANMMILRCLYICDLFLPYRKVNISFQNSTLCPFLILCLFYPYNLSPQVKLTMLFVISQSLYIKKKSYILI